MFGYSMIDYAWNLAVNFLWGLVRVTWHIIAAVLESRKRIKEVTYNGPEDQSHA